jgi:prenyltransferase beta subunit
VSFRLEMLQVARLAPNLLGDATSLVGNFLLSQLNPDGGFRDRAGRSDLYYTLFGVEGLLALQMELPQETIRSYLLSHGSGERLDFVHLSCLLRCWSALGGAAPGLAETLSQHIDKFRTADGGYSQKPNAPRCTAYGCLLGWAAKADAGSPIPIDDRHRLEACLESLRTADGGYANEPGLPFGTTTATAAAIALHRQLRRTPDPKLGTWLLQQAVPEGGFKAFPMAPMPDLLSTAVALHALDALQTNYAPFKEPCLDFIDTLWTADGGFHGTWADDFLDSEYTYYGLLALGHLSL